MDDVAGWYPDVRVVSALDEGYLARVVQLHGLRGGERPAELQQVVHVSHLWRLDLLQEARLHRLEAAVVDLPLVLVGRVDLPLHEGGLEGAHDGRLQQVVVLREEGLDLVRRQLLRPLQPHQGRQRRVPLRAGDSCTKLGGQLRDERRELVHPAHGDAAVIEPLVVLPRLILRHAEVLHEEVPVHDRLGELPAVEASPGDVVLREVLREVLWAPAVRGRSELEDVLRAQGGGDDDAVRRDA
mmetsp:Transcript_74496/g.210941  ORF Transcript_74496/g.210941 Transcript_74496/m.210941 type:complete len:241 (-) Transcript_74496:1447-2169(-)